VTFTTYYNSERLSCIRPAEPSYNVLNAGRRCSAGKKQSQSQGAFDEGAAKKASLPRSVGQNQANRLCRSCGSVASYCAVADPMQIPHRTPGQDQGRGPREPASDTAASLSYARIQVPHAGEPGPRNPGSDRVRFNKPVSYHRLSEGAKTGSGPGDRNILDLRRVQKGHCCLCGFALYQVAGGRGSNPAS